MGFDVKNVPEQFYYRFKDFKYNTNGKERVLSGIKELDYLTSGFELGCITIWTGLTNSGKTTMLTMITKNTILQGEKVFYFNGEQTKDDFKNNIYKQSVTGKDIYSVQFKDSCVFDFYVHSDKARELDRIYGDNLIIFNNEMPRDIDTLLYAMEECRRMFGIRVFFLDNFMQIDIKSDNVFQEQTDIMEKLRTFAVNKNVHIHLVAHPRKVEKFQTRLTLYDIAGSMNIANKAYNIISIMRTDSFKIDDNEYKKLALDMLDNRYDIKESNGILEVIKTKGISCGMIGLLYDKETKSYKEQKRINFEEAEKLKYEYLGKGGKEKCPF